MIVFVIRWLVQINSGTDCGVKLKHTRNAPNLLSPSGISTKKNVAINASKDFTGSHLWGNSSIPFGGTLPSRGAHGKSGER